MVLRVRRIQQLLDLCQQPAKIIQAAVLLDGTAGKWELYLHSRMVAAACRAVCALILEEEPDFFDDMEGIADEADPSPTTSTICRPGHSSRR